MLENNNTKNTSIMKKEKKKDKILIKKNNIIKSLKEVELFLNNWKKILNGIKLYKILK